MTLVEPDVTTAELAALGIRDLVSEFTTYYPPGQPRVVNIRRAAAVIDGTILPSGRDVLDERGARRADGREGLRARAADSPASSFVDSVGGGISQVATMLYNGAFFAGLELIEHQPHSLYIDRYPLGREATISWGGPELIFRNDWPASVLIKLDTTETSITVRFFSSTPRPPSRDRDERPVRARRRQLPGRVHTTGLPRKPPRPGRALPRPLRRRSGVADGERQVSGQSRDQMSTDDASRGARRRKAERTSGRLWLLLLVLGVVAFVVMVVDD